MKASGGLIAGAVKRLKVQIGCALMNMFVKEDKTLSPSPLGIGIYQILVIRVFIELPAKKFWMS